MNPSDLGSELFAHGVDQGWRYSPLALATKFSALEEERPRFEPAPHLQAISDAVVDAVWGDGKKFIIISMPPQHGKSTLVTRRTSTWFIGNHPEKRAGLCCYGAEYATEWGRKIRNDFKRHEDILGVSIAEDSKSANVWHTNQDGGLWTAGIGGSITGKPAKLLIVDDPIKNVEEAYSTTYQDGLWDWWQTVALTRTHPDSVILIVMTRWHSKDLVGRILSHEYPGDPEDWRVIHYPAIWESDSPDELGRKNGEGLWSKFSADWLIKNRKKTMDPELWEALYQQQPMNQTGIGRVYKNFDDRLNVSNPYFDPRLPLCWSLDFNVNPMCSVVGQVREELAANAILTNEKLITINILDEICIPNADTQVAVDEFIERYFVLVKSARPVVYLYGDATGGRRDTRSGTNDWEIVKRALTAASIPFRFMVGSTNPPVRSRVNEVNQMLKTPDGVRNLFIAARCGELRTDLKEVGWKKDASGNPLSSLDGGDPKRTHVSDALGYLVHAKSDLKPSGGGRSGAPR